MALYLIPKKRMNGIVARHQRTQAALAGAAEDIAAVAEARLAGHRKEGFLTVYTEHPGKGKYGSIDHFVVLEDRDGGSGEPAVYAIEFGHTTKGGKQVPGLYILMGAAGLA